MRRNSTDDSDRRYIESLAATAAFTSSFSANNSSTNVGDLICRFEKRTDRRPDVNAMREILSSSSQMQPQLEMLYYNNKNPLLSADMKLNDMSYIRFLQQQDKLRYQQRMNDSLLSLTDSEFCSDDQQQDYVSPVDRSHYDLGSENSVVNDLSRYNRVFEILSRLPVPRMSFTGMGFCFLVAVFIAPRACDEKLIFPAFRLIFGTLYPAYASYKAVRTKNVKEYVKWMMYWIVYAFFTCIETFTDIFLSWFPFYYEIKVLIVLWLLSPATKGSSTLYRKFVHPMLTRREPEIDEYINQAKEKGYTAVLQLGSKGVNYATNVIMQTALKGGGNLVQTIRRSYSLSDLSEPDDQRTQDEIDEVGRPHRILRQRNQTVRSSSGGRNVDMYFSEVDVGPKPPQPNFNYMRSSDDISSGYSSAEPVSTGLSRTASLTNATRPRFKAKRAEENVYLESDEYANMPEVRYPPRSHPYHSYIPNFPNQNPLNRSTRLTQIRSEDIADLKNQAFFDNEKYFQDVVLESLINNKQPDNVEINEAVNYGAVERINDARKINKSTKLGNIVDEEKSKDNNLPAKAEEKNTPNKWSELQESPNVKEPSSIQPSDGGIDKYQLFYKWLDDFEKMKAEQQNVTMSKDEMKMESEIPSHEDDDFRDPVDGSEDEFFHDVQTIGANNEKAADPNEKSVTEQNSTVHENESEFQKDHNVKSAQVESENSKETGVILPLILEDFTSSSKAITSDEKRPVTHHKGKAPEPPSTLLELVKGEMNPSFIESSVHNVQTEKDDLHPNISSDLPETVMTLNTSETESTIDNKVHSRSPSPRLDSKSKGGRMSIFKSYLPTFLRPESPKPNHEKTMSASYSTLPRTSKKGEKATKARPKSEKY